MKKLVTVFALITSLSSCYVDGRGCFNDGWNDCVGGWDSFFTWLFNGCCDPCGMDIKLNGYSSLNYDCAKTAIWMREESHLDNGFHNYTYVDDRVGGQSTITGDSYKVHNVMTGERNINFIDCMSNMTERRVDRIIALMTNPDDPQVSIKLCKKANCPPTFSKPVFPMANKVSDVLDWHINKETCRIVIEIDITQQTPSVLPCEDCCMIH